MREPRGTNVATEQKFVIPCEVEELCELIQMLNIFFFETSISPEGLNVLFQRETELRPNNNGDVRTMWVWLTWVSFSNLSCFEETLNSKSL